MRDHEREHDKTRLENLLEDGTPLREVVEDALGLRFGGQTHIDNNPEASRLSVSHLRLGSTVRLTFGVRLYYEPARVTDGFVVATVGENDGEEELDVVAIVGHDGSEFVGVIYAGYGLVWAMTESVTAWRLMEDVNTENGHKCQASSLALSFQSAYTQASKHIESPLLHRVSSVLSLLTYETLESLAMDMAVVMREDLVLLLKCCPRLQLITLDRCIVETLEPLADAYSHGRIGVTTLSLLGVRDLHLRDSVLKSGWFYRNMLNLYSEDYREDAHVSANALLAPLLDAFSSGTTHLLRELHIDLMGLSTADAHAALAQIARGARSLTRLHVACRNGFQDACATQLGPLRDAVLRDPPRVRCAVLSVLRAFGCGSEGDVAREVLALAEGAVVRIVTWECATLSFP